MHLDVSRGIALEHGRKGVSLPLSTPMQLAMSWLRETNICRNKASAEILQQSGRGGGRTCGACGELWQPCCGRHLPRDGRRAGRRRFRARCAGFLRGTSFAYDQRGGGPSGCRRPRGGARACRAGRREACARGRSNRPYRAFGGVAFKPEVDAGACTACGLCARACPTGAITIADAAATDAGLCVSCFRCVAVCPEGARSIGGGAELQAARDAFAQRCAARQESWFSL